jgi:hypothetical protein
MSKGPTVSPQEAEELQRLNTEYFDATRRVAEAIRTGGGPLIGPALQAVLDGDLRAAKALQRIKQIYRIESANSESANPQSYTEWDGVPTPRSEGQYATHDQGLSKLR